MKVIINEDENNNEIEIIINCKTIDDTVVKLISKLKEEDNVVTGSKNGRVYVIKLDSILYFESVDKRTFIYKRMMFMNVILGLYEVEEKFGSRHFFRASKSTVINITKISVINPVIGGRIEVLLENKKSL